VHPQHQVAVPVGGLVDQVVGLAEAAEGLGDADGGGAAEGRAVEVSFDDGESLVGVEGGTVAVELDGLEPGRPGGADECGGEDRG